MKENHLTTWTPPADTNLSSHDIDTVVDGLRHDDSRAAALAFLDKVTDSGLLHVIACRVGRDRRDRPSLSASAAGLRNFIRNRG